MVALTSSRLPEPLVSQKSPPKPEPDKLFNCRLDHSGAISRTQVERNLTAFGHPIPADLWAELKSEKLSRADAPTPP